MSFTFTKESVAEDSPSLEKGNDTFGKVFDTPAGERVDLLDTLSGNDPEFRKEFEEMALWIKLVSHFRRLDADRFYRVKTMSINAYYLSLTL